MMSLQENYARKRMTIISSARRESLIFAFCSPTLKNVRKSTSKYSDSAEFS
jgi:hypothetical protein